MNEGLNNINQWEHKLEKSDQWAVGTYHDLYRIGAGSAGYRDIKISKLILLSRFLHQVNQ